MSIPPEQASPRPASPALPEPRYGSQPWPPNWVRTVGFFFGLGGWGYILVIDNSTPLVFYGPLFYLTGLPLTRGLDILVDRLTGGKR